MPQPYVVIDQNQIRCVDVVAAAIERCRGERLHILIPDVAGFELSKAMSKGADPFLTWRPSLRPLAPFSEYVVLGRKLTDLWTAEIHSGTPTASIVDDKATELFRIVLRHLNTGDESRLRRLMDENVARVMPATLNHWSDHEGIKAIVCRLRDSLRTEPKDSTIKDLRIRTSDAIESWLSSSDGVRFVFQGIQARGASPEAALGLATAPSAYAGFLSGIAAVGLYWLAFGGLESARPENTSNDLHDLEYAILGALSHELLTIDKRLRVIHGAIREAYSFRQRWLRIAIQRLDDQPGRA